MIVFEQGNTKFNYRVAGVAIHDNKLLLHRPLKDNFWALPGGRCDMMEFSSDTIKREIVEELGVEVRVERLLWVVESFFGLGEKNCHEISLYYLINFDLSSRIIETEEIIHGIEKDKNMIYQWFEFNKLSQIDIRPEFIKDKVKNISNNIEHIIVNEI